MTSKYWEQKCYTMVEAYRYITTTILPAYQDDPEKFDAMSFAVDQIEDAIIDMMYTEDGEHLIVSDECVAAVVEALRKANELTYKILF